MDGTSAFWELVRFLLVFFGLPLALLVVPTLIVGWLALRALGGVETEEDEDGRVRPVSSSWAFPVGRERDLAGWWFTAVALLPVLLYNATVALPTWGHLLLGPWSPPEAMPSLRIAAFLVATSMLPLLGAYAAGVRLGLAIVQGDVSWWVALARGAGVASVALLLLCVAVYFDALTTNYALTDLSPEGGLERANTAVKTLFVPAIVAGALAGWTLLKTAHRWTLARPSWTAMRRTPKLY